MKTHLASVTKRAGWTLIELMLAIGVGTLVLGSVGSVMVFMNRTLDATANYAELDRQSRAALDTMVRDIRQAGGLTNFTSTTLWFTNQDGNTLEYNWDTNSSQLYCITNNYSHVLLKGCSFLRFTTFQRNPSNGTTMTFWPASNAATTKVIVIDWICKRTNYTSLTDSESVQTAKVVLRN
jgi:Tfp pilus assembly protein PilW